MTPSPSSTSGSTSNAMAEKKQPEDDRYNAHGLVYMPKNIHHRPKLKLPPESPDTAAPLTGSTQNDKRPRLSWKQIRRIFSVRRKRKERADVGSHGNGALQNGYLATDKESVREARAGHYASLEDIVDGMRGSTSKALLKPVQECTIDFDFPFENIVMSGGGSKGYAYVGALKAMEDCGLLCKVRRVGGSSAGAICGGLLAVGCSAQEIADVFNLDIKWLFQDQRCMMCCLPKIWRRFGLNPGHRFNRILGYHIARKVGNPDITFLELYQKYGRELCIVVTNLNRLRSEYCHWRTTPDLAIRTAIRISMSFPVMYEAIKYNLNGRENLYTDGGTLDQYPIHCFDGDTLELHENFGTGRHKESNNKTLGLYVVSEQALDYTVWKYLFGCDIPTRATYLADTKLARKRLKEEIKRREKEDPDFDKEPFVAALQASSVDVDGKRHLGHYEIANKDELDIKHFGHYIYATLEAILVSQRRLHVKPSDIVRTMPINCGYMGTNDYVIEPGDREFMIRQGYMQCHMFLQDYAKRSKAGCLIRPCTVPDSLDEITTREECLSRQRALEQEWVPARQSETSAPVANAQTNNHHVDNDLSSSEVVFCNSDTSQGSASGDDVSSRVGKGSSPSLQDRGSVTTSKSCDFPSEPSPNARNQSHVCASWRGPGTIGNNKYRNSTGNEFPMIRPIGNNGVSGNGNTAVTVGEKHERSATNANNIKETLRLARHRFFLECDENTRNNATDGSDANRNRNSLKLPLPLQNGFLDHNMNSEADSHFRDEPQCASCMARMRSRSQPCRPASRETII